MMQFVNTFILALLLAVSCQSCASKPTEEQRDAQDKVASVVPNETEVVVDSDTVYQQARLSKQKRLNKKLVKSLRYKAYRKLSEKSVKPIVKAYNKALRQKGRNNSDTAYIHAIAGFAWVLALKPRFAIAESHLALLKSPDQRTQYIANRVLAFAYQERGWNLLAQDHLAQYNGSAVDHAFDYDKEESIAALVVGSLAIQSGDAETARNAYKSIGESTERPWLPDAAGLLANISGGNYAAAALSLNELRENSGKSGLSDEFEKLLSKGDVKEINKFKALKLLYSESLGALKEKDPGSPSQVLLHKLKRFMNKAKK